MLLSDGAHPACALRFPLLTGCPLQPWILGALITYGVLLVLAVGFRKHQTLQMVIFVAICGAVFCAKYLNGFLAANWRALGFTQDYFDPHGIFLSLLYSSPLLLIGVFQMVSGEVY